MKFYIKQKVFTFKDKFKIMDEQQNVLYEIKGKFLSIKNKLELINQKGELLLRSERKIFTLMPKYSIYNLKNQRVAFVKKIFSLKPKFNLSVPNKNYHVDGSFFGHSFGIYDEKRNMVASISKKIISWGDTYEIEIRNEEDQELFMFLVIIIDQVIHERKHRH
ncbi:MAG: LURP-one-related/scramblase family protein [Candidatus Izemoplasmatales bacterium]